MNDAEIAWPSWKVRAGGKWTVSWQELAISGPLALISIVVLNSNGVSSAQDLPRWLLVALFSLGVVCVWVAVNHFTVLRNRATTTVNLSIVIGGAFVTGAIFGGAMALSIAFLDLPTDRSPLSRVVITAIFMAWWGVAISLILDARERIALLRQSAILDALALEGARLQEGAIVDDLRAQVAASVGVTLNRSRERLERAIQQQGDLLSVARWPRIAEELRSTAAESIRPLSRDLWNAAKGTEYRPRVWALIPFIVKNQPFRPLVVALLYVLSTGLQTVTESGLRAGGQIVALALIMIVAIMVIANQAMRRYPNHHGVIYLSALVMLQIGVFLDGPVREALGLAPVALSQLLAGVVLGCALVLITSAFGAFRKMDLEAILAVQRDVDIELVASVARSHRLAEVLRQASVAVHGSVQGRLLASAAAVDQAARSADAVQFARAIDQARMVLVSTWLSEEEDVNLGAVVERKCALWRGLSDITVDIDETASVIRGEAAVRAGHVVEEAISNALRHSSATALLISVEDASDALHITVIDNGIGTVTKIRGLGSALFDSVSGGEWSLEPRSDTSGTILTVSMSFRKSSKPPG